MKKYLLFLSVLSLILIVSSCGNNDSGTDPAPASTPTPVVTTLIDYSTNPTGGDGLGRAFYIESFPGYSMTKVTLWFITGAVGSYTVSLTATAGTYDGAILGSKTTTFSGTSGVDQAEFVFPTEVLVSRNSIVAFKLQSISAAGSMTFATASDETTALGVDCVVSETTDSTAPLSTFRRDGIAIKVEGRD